MIPARVDKKDSHPEFSSPDNKGHTPIWGWTPACSQAVTIQVYSQRTFRGLRHERAHCDRRHFKRIEFDARTELGQGEFIWPVKLIDLSLKGLLIEKAGAVAGKSGTGFFCRYSSERRRRNQDGCAADPRRLRPARISLQAHQPGVHRASAAVDRVQSGGSAGVERELGALIEI